MPQRAPGDQGVRACVAFRAALGVEKGPEPQPGQGLEEGRISRGSSKVVGEECFIYQTECLLVK